ncbi:MAG: hemerythrin domain-containing protein [Syntrophobacteraceae bacterium]
MKALEQLRAEHDRILPALDVLEKMSEKIVFCEEVPVGHLKQVLDFLQIFADKCHHGKEEGILFPEVKGAGTSREGGAIDALLSEHDRGRLLIAEIKTLLQSYERGNSGSLPVLTNPVLQYINLLRSNIWKENDLFFPMAEESVPVERQGAIAKKFAEFDEGIIDSETVETFHAMLKELSSTYL